MKEHIHAAQLQGRVAFGRVYPGGKTSFVRGEAEISLPGVWSFCDFSKNLVLYEWGLAGARLLTNLKEGKSYHITTAYFEFQNGSSVSSTPSFDRGGGRAYYDGLVGGSSDYLRVPISAATIIPNETNNALTVARFLAQTSGSLGVHGLEFSSSANSWVYGAALVASPAPDDPSQDVIISRAYKSEAEQMEKDGSSQISLLWDLSLE